MLLGEELKFSAIELGADRFGIASADRFDDAPKGFNPRNIYSRFKSVVTFLKRMPYDVIDAENPDVYTHNSNVLYGVSSPPLAAIKNTDTDKYSLMNYERKKHFI